MVSLVPTCSIVAASRSRVQKPVVSLNEILEPGGGRLLLRILGPGGGRLLLRILGPGGGRLLLRILEPGGGRLLLRILGSLDEYLVQYLKQTIKYKLFNQGLCKLKSIVNFHLDTIIVVCIQCFLTS